MKKDTFAENISVETKAKLLDEMFAYEKAVKHRSIKANITKIIPAVAAILIVIGLVTVIPMINFDGLGGGATIPPEIGPVDPNVTTNSNGYLTVLPRIVEASIFESFMENFPLDGRPRAQMLAYYSLKDISQLTGNEFITIGELRAEFLRRFPFAENDAFYVFDPVASNREIEQVLSIWNEYTNWSDEEYFAMVERYGLAPYREAMIAGIGFGNDTGYLTVLPRIVEASIFDGFMAAFPDGRPRQMMMAYYVRQGFEVIAALDLTAEEIEDVQAELLERFPFVEHGAFYIFDPHATEREILQILDIWNEYIAWSDAEYFAMVERYGLANHREAMIEAFIFNSSEEGRNQQEQERREQTAEYITVADYWWAENYPWLVEQLIIGGDTRNAQIFDILITTYGKLPDGIAPVLNDAIHGGVVEISNRQRMNVFCAASYALKLFAFNF